MHNRLYREYSYLLQGRINRENEISRKLEQGAAPDSDDVTTLRASINKKEHEMRDLYARIKASSPLLLSYIKIDSGTTGNKMLNGMTVFRFYDHDGKTGYWKISDGGVVFDYYSSSHEEFLEKQLKNHSYPVIIASEDLDTIDDKNNLRGITGHFNIVPSLDRIGLYQNASRYPVSFIIADKESITGTMLESTGLSSPDPDSTELERYNLIIDSSPSGFNITAGYLFKQRYLYPGVIKNTDAIDYENLLLLMESSLYAGVQKLYITTGADDESIVQLALNVSGFSDQVPGEKSKFTEKMFVTGIDGGDAEKTSRDGEEQAEREWALHEKSLKTGQYDSARNHLHRWYGYSTGDSNSHGLYHFQLARVNYHAGLYEKAISEIDSALDKAKGTDLENKIISFKIYILFYSGRVQRARELISRLEENTKGGVSVDVLAYRYILSVIDSGGVESDVSLYASEFNSYLNRDRLAMLAAQYLSLYGNTKTAVAMMEKWKPSYITPAREYVRAYFFGKKISREMNKSPVNTLMSIVKNEIPVEELEKKARNLLAQEKISQWEAVLVLELMHRVYEERGLQQRNDFMLSSLDLQSILSRAVWIDRIFYLRKMTRTMNRFGEYDKALHYSNLWVDAIEDYSPGSLVYYANFEKADVLSKKKQFSESYKLCKIILADMSPIFPVYPDVQLLQIENEVNSKRVKDAKERWNKISPYITPKLDYIYKLVRVRIAFLEIIGEGSASDRRLENIEKTVKEAIESIDTNRDSISYPLRMDMVKSSLNVMMSFKMSRGNHVDALYYAEVIKQLELRSSMVLDTKSIDSREDITSRFKSLKKDSDGEEFLSLLRKYPLLQYTSIARMIPLKEYQSTIPDNTMVIYMVKNHQDIFYWAIGQNSVNPGRIKGGFSSIETWLEEYRDAASLLKPVSGFSARLKSLLSPLNRYFKQHERILLIVDNDLVLVPFEITGENTMLAETHSVFYGSSILSSFIPSKNKVSRIFLAGDPEHSLATSLQNVAIKESGVKIKKSEIVPGNAHHIFAPLQYNPIARKFLINGLIFSEKFHHNPYLYISSQEYSGSSLDNVLADVASINGCGNILIDDLMVQDVNVAIFANKLYTSIHEGHSVDRAFTLAKTEIIEDNRYRHPSFWAGLRLYVKPSHINIDKRK